MKKKTRDKHIHRGFGEKKSSCIHHKVPFQLIVCTVNCIQMIILRFFHGWLPKRVPVFPVHPCIMLFLCCCCCCRIIIIIWFLLENKSVKYIMDQKRKNKHYIHVIHALMEYGKSRGKIFMSFDKIAVVLMSFYSTFHSHRLQILNAWKSIFSLLPFYFGSFFRFVPIHFCQLLPS